MNVITGHGRMKDGVASLAYAPVISAYETLSLTRCSYDRDGRNKSGHDKRDYRHTSLYDAALFGAAFGNPASGRFSTSSLGALVANCSSCGIDGRMPLVLA